MPASAERTVIGFALALDAGESGGVECVALRGVAAFAGAHALRFVTGGLFHGWSVGAGGAEPQPILSRLTHARFAEDSRPASASCTPFAPSRSVQRKGSLVTTCFRKSSHWILKALSKT